MQANATLSNSDDTGGRSLPSTIGSIAAFGLFGVSFLTFGPGVSATIAIVVALSMAIAAMTVTGLWDTDELATRRAYVRWMSSALMAALLWLAILSANIALAGYGIVTASFAAAIAFAGLVLVEALVSAAATVLFARATGSDPAIGIAAQVADKYAGLAGELI